MIYVVALRMTILSLNLSNMKNFALTMLFGLGMLVVLNAQVYTNKPVGAKSEPLVDSIKVTPYPYTLPIWGEKATALGFDLPYSAGLSVNSMSQKSEIIIDNLLVGFNGGPMYDIDEIVRIDEAIASATALTVRPDIWLLPFLNVYAILGRVKTSTEINAGVWLPDTANVWSEVSSFSTVADFDGTVMGFGITPTIGVGGGWLALDMNFAWSDLGALDKPAKSFVFGPRFGKTFRFKNPHSNLNVWVGGFRVMLKSETAGSLPLGDLFDTEDLQQKVDEGAANISQKEMELDDWWGGLSESDMMDPVNIAKYETANRVLGTAGEIVNAVDGAISTAESSTVEYSLDKALKDPWNFVVGSQYQLNKHWMIRAEIGFLGSRDQLLVSLQYRFGL